MAILYVYDKHGNQIAVPALRGKDGKDAIYTLAEGETFDDVPSDIDVVIDPNGGGSDYIYSPAKAEVGQTIVVKSVDANGKPKEWEAVDFPTGGGAVTFYSNFEDEYLYIDADATIKATKTDIELAMSQDIRLSVMGVLFCRFLNVFITDWAEVAFAIGTIDDMYSMSSTFYTAEYDPATAASEE